MTDAEKEAVLQKAGWEQTKPGWWKNTMPFEYSDLSDPGLDPTTGQPALHPRTGKVMGRAKVVPEGVTRQLAVAYEMETHRPKTPPRIPVAIPSGGM